jgi:hypothetical protein
MCGCEKHKLLLLSIKSADGNGGSPPTKEDSPIRGRGHIKHVTREREHLVCKQILVKYVRCQQHYPIVNIC